MAAKYRKVDPRIWNDEKFIALGSLEKLITLHVLTTQQANRCGIFVFSLAMAEEQTLGEGLGGGFREGFLRVVKAFGWRWDSASRVLYLPTWWKYNGPESVNVLLGNLKDLEDLPQTPLIAEFYGNCRYLDGAVLEAFRKRYPEPSPQPSPEPSPTQEQEQEQEQEGKTPGHAAGVVPPVDSPTPARKGRAKARTPRTPDVATPDAQIDVKREKTRTPLPTDGHFDAIAALVGAAAAKAAPGRVVELAKKMIAAGLDPARLAELPALIVQTTPYRKGSAITLNVLTECWPWLISPPAMTPTGSAKQSTAYADVLKGIDPATGKPEW